MKNRAIRRHHRRRMIKKAQEVQARWWGGTWGRDYTKEELHNAAASIADHLKTCSCVMCGNPRRGTWDACERLTMQERKANVDLNELKALYISLR